MPGGIMFDIRVGIAGFALSLFVNGAAAAIAFEDVSILSGVSGSATETWGAAWGDLNGDGYPDIFSTNHRNRATLFRNNADGTFSEVSREVDLSGTPGWTAGRSNVDQHGAVWGDLDNDGDQDLYLSVSSSDDQVFFNHNGLLTDNSAAMGMPDMNNSGARMSVLFDYTGDGLLDQMAASLSRPALYAQRSSGGFVSSRYRVRLDCVDDASFAHLADVDPAPGLELLCGPRNGDYPANVYAFPSGSVIDVSSSVPRIPKVNDAITADFNGDLQADIFVVKTGRHSDAVQVNSTRIETNLISTGTTKTTSFKTTGVVTFTVSMRAGAPRDGDPALIDIGSGGYSPASLQFTLDPRDSSNQGTRTDAEGLNIGYDQATAVWQIIQGGDKYKQAFVVVESDESITDLTLTGKTSADRPRSPVLLLSGTPDGYVDATVAAGLGGGVMCVSAAAGDFDNDTDEDIFLACTGGSQNIPNIIYENLGNGTFRRVANAGGAAGLVGAAVGDAAGTSESVILADYDADGFLDAFVTNGHNMRPQEYGGPKQLFRNLGNANHWLELELEGVASNRDGIGARIYVTAGGKTQYRERNGGYHRWSQNHKRIHVGLGTSIEADVRVEWPNGSSETFSGLRADSLYRLTQGGPVVRLIDADGDLVRDTDELADGTDPNDPLNYLDTDRDGVPDAIEAVRGTAPDSFSDVLDSDAGGIPDYVEFVLSPNAGQGAFEPADASDDAGMDGDGDGLADAHELALGTDPGVADTDGGGVNDGDEVARGLDPLNPADDSPDSDGDGLTDAQEDALATDPNKPDTDGGGVNDGDEVASGTDPLNPGDDVVAPVSVLCGEPPINNSTDRATILWEDCDGSGMLHLRVTGGGTPSLILYEGMIESAGGVSGLAGFSIETSDVLDTDTDPNALIYALRIYGNGIDGIDVQVSPNACFTPLSPGDLPVLLGESRVLLATPNIDLSTGEACASLPDSDGDGLTDEDEMNIYGTDLNDPDTDGGGINDGEEVATGLNPLDPNDDALDSDGDGLGDAQEAGLGTDPNNPDSDGEGLSDGDEVNIYGTDPLHRNTDRDGINDRIEIQFKGTDPLNPDTDGDGLKDGQEAGASGLGTDALNPDTDGGGTNDGTEVANGTDPFNPLDD
jgi:hypothetical protein